MPRLSIEISAELARGLERVAAANRSRFILTAIQNAVTAADRKSFIAEAEAAMERLRRTGKAVPLEAITAYMDAKKAGKNPPRPRARKLPKALLHGLRKSVVAEARASEKEYKRTVKAIPAESVDAYLEARAAGKNPPLPKAVKFPKAVPIYEELPEAKRRALFAEADAAEKEVYRTGKAIPLATAMAYFKARAAKKNLRFPKAGKWQK